jgi:hypothetical protein
MEVFRAEGRLHREGGLPALDTGGMKLWCWRGQLHRSDGPAVITKAGGYMYYLRGLHIEPGLWHAIPALSWQEIMAIQNVELRRVVMEKVGLQKFIEKCKKEDTEDALDCNGAPILASKAKAGMRGIAKNALYRLILPRDEALVFMELVNSTAETDGTFKLYYLRVPPTIKTVKEGLAWSFNVNKEEYVPVLQS